ncbi:MAG: hypothetical protein ACLUFH_00605 [Monoglobales bacterium]
MTGRKLSIDASRIREILELEFGVRIELWDEDAIKHAEHALEAYDSPEDFLVQTGWENDNPEYQSENYLTENQICRWVDGKFLYFSRILWNEACGQVADLGCVASGENQNEMG